VPSTQPTDAPAWRNTALAAAIIALARPPLLALSHLRVGIVAHACHDLIVGLALALLKSRRVI
jgi:hypothetical protein